MFYIYILLNLDYFASDAFVSASLSFTDIFSLFFYFLTLFEESKQIKQSVDLSITKIIRSCSPSHRSGYDLHLFYANEAHEILLQVSGVEVIFFTTL